MLSRCKLFKIGQDNKFSIPLNIIILYKSFKRGKLTKMHSILSKFDYNYLSSRKLDLNRN